MIEVHSSQLTAIVRADPVQAVSEVWRERYADALVIFLAGSVMRGEATPSSDLDIVVLYERLERARREAFVHGGWPVEAFVQDPETLRHYFEEDRRRGVPSMMGMVREGVEVPAPCALSAELKRVAGELYAAGPPPLAEEELRLRRFRLTDWADDIRHPRSDEELVASGTYLYGDAADFALRSRGLWSAHSKTLPRRLREADPALAGRFRLAFEALFAEKRPGPAIALVEELLEPFGGPLFDGFHLDAPPDARASAKIPPR